MSKAEEQGKASRIGRGAVVGLVSAGLALGVAELIAGLVGVRSPVIAVGDRAILLVPPFVKDIAISLFGTKDKLALLVGILATIALVAVAIGMVARRSFRAAAIGVVGICGLGMAAGLVSTDSTLGSIAPTAIGAVVGVAALFWLTHPRRKNEAEVKTLVDRRTFIISAGAFAAVATVSASGGRWLQSRVSAVSSRAAVVLPQASQPLAAIPASTSIGVDGVAPFITPNADFYRIDTALAVPQIRTEDWQLRIRGMVGRELSFTWDELMNRRDIVEADVTLTCVSNLVGGNLLGNARWLGIPVRNLLDEAGVDRKTATQIVGRSSDRYTCGFPTEAAYDGRTCIVAIGMNGEPLPLEHGFPARLITAGLYGYVSATKWLTEIQMATMENFDSYWVPRGYGKEAPIKMSSRIDVPKQFARVKPGNVRIAGFAWAQPVGIQRVEVRIDNEDWQEAELATELTESTWRQWVIDWQATPGNHSLFVRATDRDGQLQQERRSNPLPDGATGLHTVAVTVAA